MGMTKREWSLWKQANWNALQKLGLDDRQALMLRLLYGHGAMGTTFALYDGSTVTRNDLGLLGLSDRNPQLIRFLDSTGNRIELTEDGIKFVNDNQTLFLTIK